MSWVMGVLLGGLIGLILLIVIPRTLGGQAAGGAAETGTTAATTGTASAGTEGGSESSDDNGNTASNNPGTAATGPDGTPGTGSKGSASDGAGASGQVAPGATAPETEASTAGEDNQSVPTIAAGSGQQNQAAGGEAGEGDAAAGQEKFAGSCAGCHGANAEGGMGPKLDKAKAWTAEQFTAAVREGKTPDRTLGMVMPHFTTEQVSDAELNNIHAYLKTVN